MMRFNKNGSVNIEETYSGDRRFSKEEYVYLWNLFKKMDPEFFLDCRKICGHCPVDLFLEHKSKEFYDAEESLK